MDYCDSDRNQVNYQICSVLSYLSGAEGCLELEKFLNHDVDESFSFSFEKDLNWELCEYSIISDPDDQSCILEFSLTFILSNNKKLKMNYIGNNPPILESMYYSVE